ncbi:hypothetical protein JD969_17550 [Planctomycetota bacterium]|nr:hypothetical protein JD969_17550 [Planctomycetota bacterium]
MTGQVYGQNSRNAVSLVPKVGYIYPAGGERGTVVRVMIGGQMLRGAKDVHITGDGVTAKVLKIGRISQNIRGDQRLLIADKMITVQKQRMEEMGADAKPSKGMEKREAQIKRKLQQLEDKGELKNVKIPDHPLLFDIEDKSLRELKHIKEMLQFPRAKKQPNAQIANTLIVELKIEDDAPLGIRELRVATKSGLSNPIKYDISSFNEVTELEPNDDLAVVNEANLEELPAYELPIVLNGQIMPGDVDRFVFTAKQGQKLVVETQARKLIPYLADAVPGWFQATISIYDEDGNEVAFADEWRFNPDPLLHFTVPKSGEYEIEIRDAIYRGREDFVYRVKIGEYPYITHMYPLGGAIGSKTIVNVDGWNLKHQHVAINKHLYKDGIHRENAKGKNWEANDLTFVVDDVTEIRETANNNSIANSQRIVIDSSINGRIENVGDSDVFSFIGKKADKISVEVIARRLGSPIDSVVKIMTAEGEVLGWNDDYVTKVGHLHKDEIGVITHHADSYCSVELPEDGEYFVKIIDAQNKGGKEFGYRLYVRQTKPDFRLRATPSSIMLRPGGVVPIEIHVLRKDGFEGDINIALADKPSDFVIHGGFIPAGQEKVWMTVGLQGKGFSGYKNLKLIGTSIDVNERKIKHEIVAADEVMQAFLWRHLVPAENLLVMAQKVKLQRNLPKHSQSILSDGLVINKGEVAKLKLKMNKWQKDRISDAKIIHGIEGVEIAAINKTDTGLELTIDASDDTVVLGRDNMIIELIGTVESRKRKSSQQDGKAKPKTYQVSFGAIPAFAIEVTE